MDVGTDELAWAEIARGRSRRTHGLVHGHLGSWRNDRQGQRTSQEVFLICKVRFQLGAQGRWSRGVCQMVQLEDSSLSPLGRRVWLRP